MPRTLRAALAWLPLTLLLAAPSGCETWTPDDDDAGDDDAGDDDAGDDDAGDDDAGDDDAADDDVGDDDVADDDTGDDDIGDDDTGPYPHEPYPTRDAYRLKGLQPDFWGNPDDVSGNYTGGVAMNLVWAFWEPQVSPLPCDPATEQEYDGHCFVVDAAVDAAIADWTARGLVVTAIVYGVPAWARTTINCSPAAAGFEMFCAPDDPADYARFAGMVARRYNGHNGHGRVADFVIHNEVNSNTWFDIGCGQGTPCDPAAWLAAYTANYNAAYDAVIAEQTHAKVLVSLDHHFGPDYHLPSNDNALLSGQEVLAAVDAAAGGRTWRVAYHPYPPDLLAAGFSPDDWPKVTYGNLGTLAGWLHSQWPHSVQATEIQLTESGVNSVSPYSTEAAQATGVCDSLRNALGTPGIESYIYHRMTDHPAELVAGLGVGLRNDDGSAKQAWGVWAMANRVDLNPPVLDCGFEELPYVRLTRSYDAARGHWASSRLAPPSFTGESSYRLWRDPQPDTTLLFECRVADHNLLTPDPGCEGLHPLGPVGWIEDLSQPGTVPLYRCHAPGNGDHFISTDPACEGQTTESLLGYVYP